MWYWTNGEGKHPVCADRFDAWHFTYHSPGWRSPQPRWRSGTRCSLQGWCSGGTGESWDRRLIRWSRWQSGRSKIRIRVRRWSSASECERETCKAVYSEILWFQRDNNDIKQHAKIGDFTKAINTHWVCSYNSDRFSTDRQNHLLYVFKLTVKLSWHPPII